MNAKKQGRRVRSCIKCKLEITRGKAACAACRENRERAFCEKCEPSELLYCSHCKEPACSACLRPHTSNFEPYAERWLPQCNDEQHQGSNDRFCYDCTGKCAACDAIVCSGCFLSDTSVCRACILTGYEQLNKV